ncbi:MAG: hypothetical protein KBG28_12560 [Kofleriaceae bacterium]|jgi:flagellar motor switch protein FliG|nr:hypothetical protein [Kofleriaceae bacterium]MBP6839145.1 hypothetical protein [Kofleriaceae bacterium]MBP9204793.1 hypothetical protein [Kofleriaceae bacterium]
MSTPSPARAPASSLQQRHKAAIAVLALDEATATAVLGSLDEAELKKLSAAVDELDVVPDELLFSVLEELERALQRPVAVGRGGGGAYVRRLAGAALGEERANRLFAPPRVDGPPPLELLKSARVETLSTLLAEEHPQIAAVILTQLPSRTAAKVLRNLEPALAAQLLSRLSSLDDIPAHAIAEATEILVRALAATGGLGDADVRAEFDGLQFSASIINELPQATGDSLLEKIGETDQAAAGRIKEAMFTFEDLLRVEARQLGPLMSAVQSETLVVALSTASPELRDHFLSALSQRAAATIRDDLSAMAPKRVSEVEQAQREIVDLAMRLADEGKLQLPPRGGEE